MFVITENIMKRPVLNYEDVSGEICISKTQSVECHVSLKTALWAL